MNISKIAALGAATAFLISSCSTRASSSLESPSLPASPTVTIANSSRIPGVGDVRRVFVRSEIQGRHARTVIDTGSPRTTLDLEFARSLNLPLELTKPTLTIHNTLTSTWLIKRPIVVSVGGTYKTTVSNALVLDINNDPSLRIPTKVDAVIGHDILSRATLAIDYTLHRASIWPGSQDRYLCKGALVQRPVFVIGPYPAITLSINDRIGRFFIDTAAVRTVMVNKRGYYDMHLNSELAEYIRIQSPPPAPAKAIPVAELAIGRYGIADQYIWFVREDVSVQADGRVGNGAFEGHRIVLDEPARRLCILR